jgi:hypothetical protein
MKLKTVSVRMIIVLVIFTYRKLFSLLSYKNGNSKRPKTNSKKFVSKADELSREEYNVYKTLM